MPSASPAVADHLSTLSTAALQDIMRATPTRPLPALLNGRQVTVDYAHRRIWRDSYWKGSFAKDTVMGWEERLITTIRPGAPAYAGGRFFKRFDTLQGGEAVGFVVNYGLHFLPGRPVARQVRYPDGTRRYVQADADVLLMTYRNRPYRVVYDVITVVDENHCIGVMHLGTFPNGFEFATFVMARNNYPFEKMAVPDHDAIFEDTSLRVPGAADIAGSWKGYVVFLRRPDLALHNQFNPPLLRMRFGFDAGGPMRARMRIGLIPYTRQIEFNSDCVRLTSSSSSLHEIRQVDGDTLIGRVVRKVRPGVPVLRYVLVRSSDRSSASV